MRQAGYGAACSSASESALAIEVMLGMTAGAPASENDRQDKSEIVESDLTLSKRLCRR